MFIISYPNMLLGGYGDRINGLIGIKILSRIFNHEFYISWTKEDITELFNYDKYNIHNTIHNKNIPNSWKMIDGGKGKIIDYVKNKRKEDINYKHMFPNSKYSFSINSNVCKKICNIIKLEITNEEIITEYEKLYSDIFIPKNIFIQKINDIVKDKKNIVGIQIRCGDKYMITNKNESHSTGLYKNIVIYLQNIKKHCDEIFDTYNVFITSDCDEVYNKSTTIWNQENIIYNDDVIQHLDRKPINSDISKVFVDAYILSNHTIKLFITKDSNYGMVSALSCKHNDIYEINCKKISKSDILKCVLIPG